MNIITVIFLGLALAMDAFAVSVATGATYKKQGHGHAFGIASAFGGFQALMPLVGWAAGLAVRDFVDEYANLISFTLLAVIGGKMIYESFRIKQEEARTDTLSVFTVFVLAIATSIDALAVGTTFSLVLTGSVFRAVAVIGIITFALSYAGFFIGKKMGHFFETGLEMTGGIVLIIIGLKILLFT